LESKILARFAMMVAFTVAANPMLRPGAGIAEVQQVLFGLLG
jgi:hypothetical protein